MMRTKRNCNECGKLYQPKDRYGKLCEECFEKTREKACKKGWQHSRGKKVN